MYKYTTKTVVKKSKTRGGYYPSVNNISVVRNRKKPSACKSRRLSVFVKVCLKGELYV